MPLKLVSATELKSGSYAIIDDAPCIVKNIDISKTGKHGASKCRIEAVGLIDDKKRIAVMPGSERVAVPLIEKRRAQLLDFNQDSGMASLMDIESYETIEIPVSEEVKQEFKEKKVEQVEYWIVEGKKIVKRVL